MQPMFFVENHRVEWGVNILMGEKSKSNLYYTLETASKITNAVLVGFSGGKDSVVTLDLCVKYFKKVIPFFMYLVQGLEFQEKTIKYYEKKYNLEMLRVPHFMLSDFLRYESFRMPDLEVPIIKTVDLYNYMRHETGVYWICAGERISDSIVRRAMIKNSGTIDKKRGRIYPVAQWKKSNIVSYLKINKLPLSLENKALGFSFRSLMGADMIKIKEYFPNDFERIKRDFPLIEATIRKELKDNE